MSNDKRKQISEWALADYKNINNIAIQHINDSIEQLFKSIHKFIELKQEFEVENSMIDLRQVESVESDLIEIIDYKENEFIVFESKIFPLNYYKVESFRYYSEVKNLIIKAVSEKLSKINLSSNSEIINNWDKSIMLLQLKKDGQVSDFDNYFCKPFIDGIRNSRFIKDDSSDNLSIIYSNLISKTRLIRITLINHIHIEKYKNLIFEIVSL